jgi:hypothetical protein
VTVPPVASAARPEPAPVRPQESLLRRLVRWSLPAALVVAAVVAVLGLGGTLFGSADAPPVPTVALDLTGPSAAPAAPGP